MDDVLPQDFDKYRIHEIRVETFWIVLKLDGHLDSSVAEVPVTFCSDAIIIRSKLTIWILGGTRLGGKTPYRLMNRGPVCPLYTYVAYLWWFQRFDSLWLSASSVRDMPIIHQKSWEISYVSWASYQIRKIAGCACAGNAGNVFPRRRFHRKSLVSDPGMHHGTCVTHVPWCMSESLTCGDGENVFGIPGACAPAILRIW